MTLGDVGFVDMMPSMSHSSSYEDDLPWPGSPIDGQLLGILPDLLPLEKMTLNHDMTPIESIPSGGLSHQSLTSDPIEMPSSPQSTISDQQVQAMMDQLTVEQPLETRKRAHSPSTPTCMSPFNVRVPFESPIDPVRAQEKSPLQPLPRPIPARRRHTIATGDTRRPVMPTMPLEFPFMPELDLSCTLNTALFLESPSLVPNRPPVRTLPASLSRAGGPPPRINTNLSEFSNGGGPPSWMDPSPKQPAMFFLSPVLEEPLSSLVSPLQSPISFPLPSGPTTPAQQQRRLSMPSDFSRVMAPDQQQPIEFPMHSRVSSASSITSNTTIVTADKPRRTGRPRSNSSSSKDNFKCDICSATFVRRHDLKRHEYIHTGSKPYKCELCEMAFTRPDALQKHIIGNRCAKRSAVENATASQAGQVPMQAMPGMIQSSMLTPPKHSSIQVQVPGRIVSGHQVMHARPRGPPPAGLMAIRYGKRRCTF